MLYKLLSTPYWYDSFLSKIPTPPSPTTSFELRMMTLNYALFVCEVESACYVGSWVIAHVLYWEFELLKVLVWTLKVVPKTWFVYLVNGKIVKLKFRYTQFVNLKRLLKCYLKIFYHPTHNLTAYISQIFRISTSWQTKWQ